MTHSDIVPEEVGPRSHEAPARLEIPLAAALSSLLLLSFLILPAAGPLTLPVASVPMVRLAFRRGAAPSLLSIAAMALVLFGLGWATQGVTEAIRMALFGGVIVGLPCAFAAAVRPGSNGSAAFLGLCIAGFAILVGGLLLESRGRTDLTGLEIERVFDEVASATPSAAGRELDTDTQARLKATLAAARDFAKKYWIGLIGVAWVFGGAISFYVGAWAARPAPIGEQVRFELLRIPALVAPLFVLSGAVLALGPPAAANLAGDLLWPLLALYFVGGLSIICHFARKWFRSRLLRIGIYALIIYVPINVGVALLGLFDWYTDFRRRGEGVGKQP
ncbi:MAG TPA: DUF2232 domain-containing protein [Thermoanaerobaculia bacterium]